MIAFRSHVPRGPVTWPSTKDGVVHLKGTVPNEQAKAEAERLAKDTDGVVSVTNDIKVSPPEKLDCRLAEPRLATGCAPGTPVAVGNRCS